jgi:peptidoglycan/LPS O-acetylase OafA/YrhL
MVVVVGHALMLWNAPYPHWWQLLYQSPLGILFASRDAVFVFFIMSGFVLFLPYITPEGPSPYPRYLIKRTCRIYLPYLFALAICYGGFRLPATSSFAFDTLAYSGLFLIGSLLARHLPQIRAFMERIHVTGRLLAVCVMFACFKSTHFLKGNAFNDANVVPLHSIGCALLVVLALTTVHFKRFLHTGPLRWVGKVSYSLYLLHAVILWSFVSLFWLHTTHHILLILLAIAVSLVAADLAYRWVERPAILLGRRLTGRHAPVPTPPLQLQP